MTSITDDLSFKGVLRRISVLFIFLLNCEVTVVGTALGEISKAFPDADPILISLVYTFPIFIMVLINFFVVPPLAERYNKKHAHHSGGSVSISLIDVFVNVFISLN